MQPGTVERKDWTRKFRGSVVGVLGIVCAGCMLAPGDAQAGTLDQQQTEIAGGGYEVFVTNGLAETFTAGLTGGLDQVDLYLSKNGAPTLPLNVEIRDVTSGKPSSVALASVAVAPSSVTSSGGWVSIAFAPPVAVAAGTRYAIDAYSLTDGSKDYRWPSSIGDLYAGGLPFYTTTPPPAAAWSPLPTQDFAFKTYVSPPTALGPTGERAAALKKCRQKARKHDWSHKKRKKCKKKAKTLPV
jgi:hypothetical protein